MNIVTLTDIVASSLISRERDPLTVLANREAQSRALAAVATLPERYREALTGHPRAIAQERGCSRQQVYLDRKKALAKVRRQLRVCFD